MRKLTLLTATLTLPLLASSQMRILSNGHIIAGYDPAKATASNTLVPDSTSVMTIATNNSKNIGGAISFGSEENVRIGESATYDNMLDLKGSDGITYSDASGIVFLYDPDSASGLRGFTFAVPLVAPKYLSTSDSRLKSDVHNLEGRGEGLFSLTPVSYKLAIGPASLSSAYTSSDELSSAQKTQKLSEPADSPTVDEYGFIAQEVREIFPELVVEREDGILMVDYQGMIPLLVDALSSLRDKVAQQEKVIATLTGETPGRRLAPTASSNSLTLTGTSISQNRPNPTSGMTVIDLSVSEDVAQAFVAFYDLTGRQLKRFDIAERGKSTLTIADGEFVPGIYVYSLVADGEEVQTRRMVVSE